MINLNQKNLEIFIKKSWFEIILAFLLVFLWPEDPLTYIANYVIEIGIKNSLPAFKPALKILAFFVYFLTFKAAFEKVRRILKSINKSFAF